MTVFKRWTRSTSGFQTPVTSIMRGPQELEKKSSPFPRFDSRIVKSRHMHWHISGSWCGSWHSSGKTPREIPSIYLLLLHTFDEATSSWYCQFFGYFEEHFWLSDIFIGSLKVRGFLLAICPTRFSQESKSLVTP